VTNTKFVQNLPILQNSFYSIGIEKQQNWDKVIQINLVSLHKISG